MAWSRIGTPAIGTTSSLTTPAKSHTAGNALIAIVACEDYTGAGSFLASISNTAGDTWTMLGQTRLATGVDVQLAYVPSTAGHASDVITITTTGGATFPKIVCLEYSGLDLSGGTDGTPGGNTIQPGSSASATSGSTGTTTGSDDLLLACVRANNGESYSAWLNSFTEIVDDDVIGIGELLASGTGTFDTGATLSSSAAWAMRIWAFKAASGAAPTVASTTPSDNATGVSPNLSALTITYSENVSAGSGNYVLKNDTRGTTIATVAIGSCSIASATVTIPVNVMLEYGHAYHVEADAGVVVASDDAAAVAAISNSTTWDFTALNAIDFVAAGAAGFTAASGTSMTATFPETATDERGIDVLAVGVKPAINLTGQVSVPDSAGFRKLGSYQGGGGGTFGADTGNTDIHIYWRPASPSTGGTFTVTDVVGTNGVAWAKIWRFKSNVAGAIKPVASFGNQSATGNVSLTFDTNPDTAKTRPGDLLFAVFGGPTDANAGAMWSAEALTQTGVTFGTVAEESEWSSGNGNDIGAFACYAQVLAGMGLGKITLSATAATTTNMRGPAAVVRLRAG